MLPLSFPNKESSDLVSDDQRMKIDRNQSREEALNVSDRQLESENQELKTKSQVLETEKQKLEVENQELSLEVSRLHEIIRILQIKQFGSKSEKVNPDQLRLFNEPEHLINQETKAGVGAELEVRSYKRAKGKRQPLPKELEREEIVIKLEGEACRCPEGHELKEIGEESSEQLDIIPAKVKVIRTIRKKYACPSCEEHVKLAPLPPAPIPKSIATSGLLSYILLNKYVDGLPLYRQESMFKRHQIEISRTSMARWMIQVGELLRPLWNLLEEQLLDSSYISCDETRVQVLREAGRAATSQSYMWVRYRAGPSKIVLYEYSPNRTAEVANQLLMGFKGYLQVDGYGSYNEISRQEGVIRVGCWAHVRRKFYEAYEASKKGQGLASEMLKKIQGLYVIEKQSRDKKVSERYELRQEKSKPILEDIKHWKDQNQGAVPPKSKLGQAMTYLHNEWPHLCHYIEDGQIEIDNNAVENAIRPFAIGRKNWLFSDSVAGAQSSAVIYSLVETAKANGLDLYAYFKYVLQQLPQCEDLDSIDALLPDRFKANQKTQNSPSNSIG